MRQENGPSPARLCPSLESGIVKHGSAPLPNHFPSPIPLSLPIDKPRAHLMQAFLAFLLRCTAHLFSVPALSAVMIPRRWMLRTPRPLTAPRGRRLRPALREPLRGQKGAQEPPRQLGRRSRVLRKETAEEGALPQHFTEALCHSCHSCLHKKLQWHCSCHRLASGVQYSTCLAMLGSRGYALRDCPLHGLGGRAEHLQEARHYGSHLGVILQGVGKQYGLLLNDHVPKNHLILLCTTEPLLQYLHCPQYYHASVPLPVPAEYTTQHTWYVS